jgi:hypothetical protein
VLDVSKALWALADFVTFVARAIIAIFSCGYCMHAVEHDALRHP